MQLHAKAGEAELEARERDRGVRGTVASASWEQNAHAHDPGREAYEHEVHAA